MIIDTNFDFYSDANGRDPDSASPTLRSYHKQLWSKPLPNGDIFQLSDIKGAYLYSEVKNQKFFLGSDAITHSYKNHKRKKWLINQVIDDVEELFKVGSTIGAYTLFPNNRINSGQTINQARGVNGLIDDRFDLTLECIRLYYLNQPSPLYETLKRYNSFFDLFINFKGYVDFFLLNDLISVKGEVLFYLPFDNFRTRPSFNDVTDYRNYKKGVITFIRARNKRIKDFVRQYAST